MRILINKQKYIQIFLQTPCVHLIKLEMQQTDFAQKGTPEKHA
jgi:hypothetical protein